MLKKRAKLVVLCIISSLILQGCMFGRNARRALIGPDYVYQRPTVVLIQQRRGR